MVSKLVGLRNEIITVVTAICITVVAVAADGVDPNTVIITLAGLGGSGVLGRAVTSAARAKSNGNRLPEK